MSREAIEERPAIPVPGTLPLSQLAQRWLGPYATTFNLVHRRAGHLFQGRFRSALVEGEPYLLELVRYVHLNPVRSRLPVTVDTLDVYPFGRATRFCSGR